MRHRGQLSRNARANPRQRPEPCSVVSTYTVQEPGQLARPSPIVRCGSDAIAGRSENSAGSLRGRLIISGDDQQITDVLSKSGQSAQKLHRKRYIHSIKHPSTDLCTKITEIMKCADKPLLPRHLFRVESAIVVAQRLESSN